MFKKNRYIPFSRFYSNICMEIACQGDGRKMVPTIIVFTVLKEE